MAMRRPARTDHRGRQPIVCAKIKYALSPVRLLSFFPPSRHRRGRVPGGLGPCLPERVQHGGRRRLPPSSLPTPILAAPRCCAPEMAPSGEPGGEDLLKRAFETHSQDAVGFLILAKTNLGDQAYKQLIKTVQEIVKQSSCTEGGITVKECEEILSEVFAGQSHVLKGFQHLLEGRNPFHDHDSPQDLEAAQSFLVNVKRSCVCDEDYNDLLSALSQATVTKKVEVEEIYAKVKRAMHQCPEFIEMFETYLPDHLRMTLPNQQSCRSPETSSADKAVVCCTPDANHSWDGTGESFLAQEHDGDKTDPLPDWSPSRENELPLKCLTLKSSYRTELGRSIFNDTLVSATSGREDCFKFRTKNHYEENIFKCEDDMFESDMLLHRYKATADFIGNLLQDHVDSAMRIQEHLTPLHRRCIEQLYDEHGLDMLDALWEKIDTSTVLAILHSRLNQKIEELSEARLSLIKTCSNNISNNYHRSLDHRSSSFKQLDKRRMRPKALLAEARDINMAMLKSHDKHLSSACNNQSSLIPENASEDTNRGRYLVNMSSKPASIHDDCQTDIEDGEFIPDVGNVQLGSRIGPGNTAESCDVAVPNEDDCDHCDKSDVRHESREGNVEMGNLAYPKRTDELGDVKGIIPCCSLAVLLRLHQIVYERLLEAKNLSRESRTCGVYEGFMEELFSLLTGSTNSSNFENYCLTVLGPKSYVLFTLHEVIGRLIKQLCKICPGAEHNSLLQPHETVLEPDPSVDLSHHQNARRY
nr:unnamed protein product [Digitaria exilis]